MSRRRLAIPFVLAVAASLLPPSLALAHAELESATPGPDDTVAVAPTELVATFTEALDGSKSSIEVRDGAGTVVANGGADLLGADGITMTLPLPALANGTYEVRWTSAALDGHIERGTYEFTVAVPASSSSSPSPSSSAGASAPASPSTAASPSSNPEASTGTSPSPSPGSGEPGGGDTGLDLATLLPIAAALVVVVVLGAWFVRRRRG